MTAKLKIRRCIKDLEAMQTKCMNKMIDLDEVDEKLEMIILDLKEPA